MGNRKGWIGEDRAEKWAQSQGWPAYKPNNQAHSRGDTPDVIVDYFGLARVFLEAKNNKAMPGVRVLADLAQSEGYCGDEEIPWLLYHVHGTSQDVVVMEKRNLERTIRTAFEAGQRTGAGGLFTDPRAVASVQADGLGDRLA